MRENAQGSFSLGSLSPDFIENQHSPYVRALEDALKKDNASEIHNIALAGAYGTGKSSVLKKIVANHHKEVVQISLSTIGEAPVPEGEDRALFTTNLIQKEIVKQILYQASPKEVRSSHYRQSESFNPGRAALLSVLASFVVTSFLFFTGGSAKLLKLFSPKLTFPEVLLDGIAVALISCGIFAFLWLFHNQLNLKTFSVAKTEISLKGSNDETYFDEYLDEIVHFFAVKKHKSIVIFEDIDRFEESYVFETLRALNTVLNRASKLNGRHIRFIYAMKDSIFDEMGNPEATGLNSNQASANRTKFFDLVVPMVPFLTHLNARDVMKKQLEKSNIVLDEKIVELTARHITDMRTLIEVCNEYLIFRSVVFSQGSPSGGEDPLTLDLRAESLFALMLYKNVYLLDFEKIRSSNSQLDLLYSKRLNIISEGLRKLDQEAIRMQNSIYSNEKKEALASSLGASLLDFSSWFMTSRSAYQASPTEYKLNGVQYDLEEIKQAAFWEQLAALPDTAMLEVKSTHQDSRLLLGSVRKYLQPTPPTANWTQEELEKERANLPINRQQRVYLSHASMAELYADSAFTTSYEGKEQTFAQIVHSLFASPLVGDLIASGYLDENFTLYTSKYYSESRSQKATNFILHSLKRNQRDPEFELTLKDVNDIIRDESEQVLDEVAMRNLSVVDGLLEEEKIEYVERLIRGFNYHDENDRSFLASYFDNGRFSTRFAQLLSPVWEELLVFLTKELTSKRESKIGLVDAALQTAHEELPYLTDDSLKTLLENSYQEMGAFTGKAKVHSLKAIVEIAAANKVLIRDLSSISKDLRQQIANQGLYLLNRNNLLSALDDPAISLSLDSLQVANVALYNKALQRPAQYLGLLKEDEFSVEDKKSFNSIANAIAETCPSFAAQLFSEAAPECVVDDLNEVNSRIWKALVETNRIKVSLSNLKKYIQDSGGIDEPLGKLLSTTNHIDFEEDATEEALHELGMQILTSKFVYNLNQALVLLRSLGVSLADLSRYAAAQDLKVSPAILLSMTQHNAEQSTVLALLEHNFQSVDTKTLLKILLALEKPYAELAEVNGRRITIENTSVGQLILDRLQKANIVSTYTLTGSVFYVHMKRKKAASS